MIEIFQCICLLIFVICGLIMLNKQLKEDNKIKPKEQKLIDLMIKHYEIDNEK